MTKPAMSVRTALKKIKLTPDQSKAHRSLWYKRKRGKKRGQLLHRAVACVTGYGGGKSFLNAVEANVAAAMYPGIWILVGSPSYAQMQNTIWRSLNEITPEANMVRRNSSAGSMSMTLDFHDGKKPLSHIICLSASISVLKWQGPNLGMAILDESDGIPRAHYEQCWARLRMDKMPNNMFIATNPPPNDHWLSQDFYYNRKKGYKLLQWSSADNPYLPEQTIENLYDTFQGEEALAKIHGQIGVGFEGQFFDNFRPQRHILTPWKTAKIRRESPRRIYGVDWGYIDPFVVVELCWWPDKEAWVVTNEFYRSRLTTKEQAEAILALWDEESPIYSDHAAQSRADIEDDYGIITEAAVKTPDPDTPSTPGMISSLHEMRRQFNRRRNNTFGLYFGANCTHSIREMGSFRYKKHPITQELQEDKFEGADHAVDAIRYALYSEKHKGRSFIAVGGDRESVPDLGDSDDEYEYEVHEYENALMSDSPFDFGDNDDAYFGD